MRNSSEKTKKSNGLHASEEIPAPIDFIPALTAPAPNAQHAPLFDEGLPGRVGEGRAEEQGVDEAVGAGARALKS